MGKDAASTAETDWRTEVFQTVPDTGPELWDFLVSREGVGIWLGPCQELPRERGARYETESGTTGVVRAFRDPEEIRLTWRPRDWDHDSTLQVTVDSSGQSSTLRVRQEMLANATERDEQREYWTDVIERVVTALSER